MSLQDDDMERRKTEAARRFLEAIDAPAQPNPDPWMIRCLDAMELQMMGIKP